MKTKIDCIPCMIRQTVEAVRLVTNDELLQRKILQSILRSINNPDFEKSPPELAQKIHKKIRELTGVADPYKNVKEKFNSLAKSMLDELKEQIDNSPDPVKTAVKLAVAGNIIDSGVGNELTEAYIRNSINRIFSEKFEGDIDDFCKEVSNAEKILYLADNAGEIFFDRLLLEKIEHPGITLAVRGYPVLNDATMKDAFEAGINRFAEIIGNGSDAPGTIPGKCSEEFNNYYNNADLIISKGQGNFETLCDEKKNIYFLFKVKCAIASGLANLPEGSNAVIRSIYYCTQKPQ